MRRKLKIAAYLALMLLGGLLLLTYYTVVNPLYVPLRDALVRTVTRTLSQSLHGSVEIGALRGSLFSAPVLHNVVLRDAHGTVVGQIAAIRLAYDLKALLRRRLEVYAVEIVQPQLTVVQEPDGSLNLTKLFPASSTAPSEKPAAGGGLPFALRVDTLRIRDGQVTLDLPSLPGVRQVDGLQMQMSAQMDPQGFRAHIQQFVARTSPAVIDLHTFQGALHMQDGVIQVEDLRVQTGETLITAHGVLPGSTAPADFVLHMQPLALA